MISTGQKSASNLAKCSTAEGFSSSTTVRIISKDANTAAENRLLHIWGMSGQTRVLEELACNRRNFG
jgi:hypothetical protein